MALAGSNMSNNAKLKPSWAPCNALVGRDPSPLTPALHVSHVVIKASSIQHSRLNVVDTAELILVQQGAGGEYYV